MPDSRWTPNSGAHCQCWYDNETCHWCGDPPSDDPDNAEETPCPGNENGVKE